MVIEKAPKEYAGKVSNTEIEKRNNLTVKNIEDVMKIHDAEVTDAGGDFSLSKFVVIICNCGTKGHKENKSPNN